MIKFRLTVLALTGCLLGGFTSCTNVKQFQRGYLAEYVMSPNKDGLAKGMADHMYFSREAAYGGEGVGGGGCGCN